MKIHQMLHGYAQGHNLITSSIQLEIEDSDIIKRLSDWTGYLTPNGDGYLTAYPLPSNNNLYIISKTWYASEMKRPGCVWTHSLLIDLTELTNDFNFLDLLSYFARPTDNNITNYSHTINYEQKEVRSMQANFQHKDVIFFYGILCQLSTSSIARIEHSTSYYEQLCLSVLQYLPLGFIRHATICTGVINNRKYGDTPFMLQLVEQGGMKVSDISSNDQRTFINQFGGISYICNAITQNAIDTAYSLRLFSHDILTSTPKLNTIGFFLYALDKAISGNREIKFSNLARLILQSFPESGDGSFVKSVLYGKNVSNLFDTELNVLTFLATENDLNIDNDIKKDYSTRVQSLTKNDYIKYLSVLSDAEELTIFWEKELLNAGKKLSSNDFIMLIDDYWTVFYSIASLSPEILYNDFWLNTNSNQFSKIFEIFKRNQTYIFENWAKLYKRLLDEKIIIPESIYNLIVSNTDYSEYVYLDYINNSDKCAVNKFPDRYAASKPNSVIKWLSVQKTISRATVLFIINNLSPVSTEVKHSQSKDWGTFAEEQVLLSNEYYLFLFQLSHNWADETAINFLRKSFYVIHSLLAQNKLTDSQKSCLKPYYANVPIWQEWDLCKKLRKGLIMYFRTNDINPSRLLDFTPDSELNEMLTRIWDKAYNRRK